jgi:hypothetical protein
MQPDSHALMKVLLEIKHLRKEVASIRDCCATLEEKGEVVAEAVEAEGLMSESEKMIKAMRKRKIPRGPGVTQEMHDNDKRYVLWHLKKVNLKLTKKNFLRCKGSSTEFSAYTKRMKVAGLKTLPDDYLPPVPLQMSVSVSAPPPVVSEEEKEFLGEAFVIRHDPPSSSSKKKRKRPRLPSPPPRPGNLLDESSDEDMEEKPEEEEVTHTGRPKRKTKVPNKHKEHGHQAPPDAQPTERHPKRAEFIEEHPNRTIITNSYTGSAGARKEKRRKDAESYGSDMLTEDCPEGKVMKNVDLGNGKKRDLCDTGKNEQ